ncbi:hypothetical protein PPL_08920 [Heterostelium album PN500]|uniref:Uncharacterized protein n=1 Tax=Heterostelium pallidum (strain ATCC 26659 / Pp 5 / PN500) TaxID=670386 RepID=D3BK39_HETP5|nr:hypothetical protein PPL_08920 [Heterostelium album PN500]EFA78269.1 hypothetical protein PPL_08920 [Heterostelium album PN500]|eukprot:XP_020430394.1 hypothetical protein PPL_08920 [Heterostelium album PN500]
MMMENNNELKTIDKHSQLFKLIIKNKYVIHLEICSVRQKIYRFAEIPSLDWLAVNQYVDSLRYISNLYGVNQMLPNTPMLIVANATSLPQLQAVENTLKISFKKTDYLQHHAKFGYDWFKSNIISVNHLVSLSWEEKNLAIKNAILQNDEDLLEYLLVENGWSTEISTFNIERLLKLESERAFKIFDHCREYWSVLQTQEVLMSGTIRHFERIVTDMLPVMVSSQWLTNIMINKRPSNTEIYHLFKQTLRDNDMEDVSYENKAVSIVQKDMDLQMYLLGIGSRVERKKGRPVIEQTSINAIFEEELGYALAFGNITIANWIIEYFKEFNGKANKNHFINLFRNVNHSVQLYEAVIPICVDFGDYNRRMAVVSALQVHNFDGLKHLATTYPQNILNDLAAKEIKILYNCKKLLIIESLSPTLFFDLLAKPIEFQNGSFNDTLSEIIWLFNLIENNYEMLKLNKSLMKFMEQLLFLLSSHHSNIFKQIYGSCVHQKCSAFDYYMNIFKLPEKSIDDQFKKSNK